MAAKIQGIFIDPPIAVARLGGSTTPLDSYRWIDSSDPHLQTVIAPDWSLDIGPDGTVAPRMPQTLIFRDGSLIRPVAPFFEIWALMGEDASDPQQWQQTPLTADLLKQAGSSLMLAADARNRKAARRARNNQLEFGTFPPITINSDDRRVTPLIATSPTGVAQPMIPRGSRGIPLGTVQILQDQPQPASGRTAWADQVRVDTLRFRFTPAKGEFYGPSGVQNNFNQFAPVKPENAFLNGAAGWAGTPATDWVEPSDTYDGAEQERQDSGQTVPGLSIGIVDDTCSVVFTVTLTLPGRQPLIARAAGFVSPPDFAPDRRPFMSLADELNDRASRTIGTPAPADLDAWVRDLFERVYETASLFNLDLFRAARAITLPDANRRPAAIPGDRVPTPEAAMGGLDQLRDPNKPILETSSDDVPLPLSERAKERHRDLAELDSLKDLILSQSQRLKALVRPPFTLSRPFPEAPDATALDPRNESGDLTTMQMPPFMRQSNANPLTLAQWQYDLLMKWASGLAPAPAAVRRIAPVAPPLSSRARSRRNRVAARLGLRVPGEAYR
jgi:hypothetical protein